MDTGCNKIHSSINPSICFSRVYYCYRLSPVFRIRIRMDPGFFADPEPDFKNPEPAINKLIGSKWCFWLGFGGTWPKKDSVESAKFEINKFSTCTWIRIFRIRSRFLADPDPYPGKKVWSGTLIKSNEGHRTVPHLPFFSQQKCYAWKSFLQSITF